jgi:hypothetical protein
MYGRGVGILLTGQFLLSASAQDGFGAAQDNPAAANRAEIHLHNYGEFDKACMTWTDGCRNWQTGCTRADCSTCRCLKASRLKLLPSSSAEAFLPKATVKA